MRIATVRPVAGILLIAAGIATFWWSGSMMLYLIHLVGEERALGANNVFREGGSIFLTNPTGMARWSSPFWIAGAIQVSTGIVLLLWRRRPEWGGSV